MVIILLVFKIHANLDGFLALSGTNIIPKKRTYLASQNLSLKSPLYKVRNFFKTEGIVLLDDTDEKLTPEDKLFRIPIPTWDHRLSPHDTTLDPKGPFFSWLRQFSQSSKTTPEFLETEPFNFLEAQSHGQPVQLQPQLKLEQETLSCPMKVRHNLKPFRKLPMTKLFLGIGTKGHVPPTFFPRPYTRPPHPTSRNVNFLSVCQKPFFEMFLKFNNINR